MVFCVLWWFSPPIPALVIFSGADNHFCLSVALYRVHNLARSGFLLEDFLKIAATGFSFWYWKSGETVKKHLAFQIYWWLHTSLWLPGPLLTSLFVLFFVLNTFCPFRWPRFANLYSKGISGVMITTRWLGWGSWLVNQNYSFATSLKHQYFQLFPLLLVLSFMVSDSILLPHSCW